MKIQIEPKHLKILKDIFNHQIPDLFVFGSRSKGTAKEFSDLDLVTKGAVDKSIIRKIREQLEDSNLPYKVDLVIWSDLDQAFQKNIEKDLVRFNI